MKLANPFPTEVRELYRDCWKCSLCGCNGQNRGGLSLHHILGRISGSAFNCSILCGYCHEHMNHNQEEEQKLFNITLQYLYEITYQPTEKDYQFLRDNGSRLFTEDTGL